MGVTAPRTRPRIVVWWEELPIGVQILVTIPVAVAVMWALHRFVFDLAAGRSLTYAGFWGLLATFAVVGATRAERARRRARERTGPPGGEQ